MTDSVRNAGCWCCKLFYLISMWICVAGFTLVVTCALSGFMARVWELVLKLCITWVHLSARVVAEKIPSLSPRSFTVSVGCHTMNLSTIYVCMCCSCSRFLHWPWIQGQPWKVHEFQKTEKVLELFWKKSGRPQKVWNLSIVNIPPIDACEKVYVTWLGQYGHLVLCELSSVFAVKSVEELLRPFY